MNQNTKTPLPHNPPRTCGECGKMKFFPKGAPVNMKKCECDKNDNSPKTGDSMDLINKKALDWISNGRVGMSSKTMWSCFMGVENFPVNHPYDPDDFSRCYNLLEHVPEWKDQLDKLKPLSKQWSNLVDNWTTLTLMYERNVEEEWVNHKDICMYEFMQTLIS